MGRALDNLIAAWQETPWKPGVRNVLAGDVAALSGNAVAISSWDDFCRNSEFEPELFHTHLMPMPWVGNLRTAKVFLLQLNPGVGAHDYFGEHRVPEYLAMLEANLKQRADHAFPFLGPEFGWHGGANYWQPKLNRVVESLDGDWTRVAAGIAVLELVPYHSRVFARNDRWVGGLESTRLMQAFVREELLPDHQANRRAVILMRAHARWGVDELAKPEPGRARGATLSETDLQRIVETLKRS